MLVSDLVNQYHNNLAAGSEVSTGTKGVEQLVETAKQLKAGNIFEGTVNSIKGSQVILGLSSGQNITARLDRGVVLQKGQSVFFQVRSNDGAQIQIRPVSWGNTTNPTLLSALDAASIPVTEKNLNMVNAMMKEQMSINSKSLVDMVRTVVTHPNADVTTLVEMTKLNLPITDELVTQYEDYKNHQGLLSQKFDAILDAIPQALTSADQSLPDAFALHNKITDFFLTGNFDEDGRIIALSDGGGQVSSAQAESGGMTATDILITEGEISEEIAVGGSQKEALQGNLAADAEASLVRADIRQEAGGMTFASPESLQFLASEEYAPGTLGRVLPENTLREFNGALQAYPDFVEHHPNLFTQNGLLRPEAEAADVLRAIGDMLRDTEGFRKEDVAAVFGHKAYKSLLGHMMEQSWMMKPEELLQKDGVKEFYEKLAEQTGRFQQLLSQYVKEDAPLAKSATQLQDNLTFMNEINQTYTYVQIPMKLSQQNVNGELYVYANKKNGKNSEDGVSAFLHFDMDHLGSMDISVKLKGRNVDAKWYLDSPQALELMSNNIHLLQQRLAAKGYQCNVDFEEQGRSVNFVEDFLKKDVSTGGQVHRYSFDVRA